MLNYDQPDARGHFGPYGGTFVAETLIHALHELEATYARYRVDPEFQAEFRHELEHFVGRPSPIYHAVRTSREIGGAQIHLKREDLNHTGAHKVNNTIGQALLARHMGKPRVIAETGAGQHGVATATICARYGMQCVVYMGSEDIKRQSPNVYRPQQVQYDLATGGPRPRKTFSESAALYAGALQYIATNYAHRKKSGADLEVPDEELAEPFGILADRHGFSATGATLDTYLTGYGYGYPRSTPAVFGFRMLGPDSIVGAASGELLMWENGTTPIWEGVAKDLDVRLGVRVQGIDRSGERPVVTTSEGASTFDRVVVACDPIEALGFLDASAEEQQLFAHVKHMPYSTFACRVRGVSEGRAEVGYLRENMTEGRQGHPMAWIKRYADDDVCVFHLFAPEDMADDEVVTKIREDMEKLGATDVELVKAMRWKFFPHVDGDAMRCDRFFERAKNLQGEKGTFFANEVLSMSTMANVHQFAKTIAERVAHSG